jgi:hypothetical protein
MWRFAVLAAFLVLAVPASATTSRILAPLDWWPSPSPAGTHVGFTRVYSNHMELELLDLRTKTTVRVGSNAGQLDPAWSSDGTRLAYNSGGLLWEVDPNGAGRRRYPAPMSAFAPAWRPRTTTLAYLTTHDAENTDLWVGRARWARNVIGRPSWSPDGKALAFQRDDGIYVASGASTETRLASIASPGAPVWSPDGSRLAYSAGSVIDVVRSDGTAAPEMVANALAGAGTPSWSADGVHLAVPYRLGITLVRADGSPPATGTPLRGAAGPGVAYAAGSGALLASAARPACPGHVGITEFTAGGWTTLSGSCVIAGTAGADVIEGTASWGDLILAGRGDDRVHANDGHSDRVDCGPGRDTVWADRSDRLTGCELVHR